MTDPSTEVAEAPVTEIDFEGRAIFVRLPTPEQIVVWQRVVKQLQNLESGEWTGEHLVKVLDRSRRLIDSLLVHPGDVEWLDDEMLDGKVTIVRAATIIQKSMDAFQKLADEKTAESGNREERRAAKKAPAKKAVRRKAT